MASKRSTPPIVVGGLENGVRLAGDTVRRRTDLKGFELPTALRAGILLAVVLDLPVLGATVRRMTPEPRTEEIEIQGVPVEVVRPRGRGPWPAWVFVNGAHPLRRREPIVHLLAQGL